MIYGIFMISGTERSIFMMTQSCYALTDTLIDWGFQTSIMDFVRADINLRGHIRLPRKTSCLK